MQFLASGDVPQPGDARNTFVVLIYLVALDSDNGHAVGAEGGGYDTSRVAFSWRSSWPVGGIPQAGAARDTIFVLIYFVTIDGDHGLAVRNQGAGYDRRPWWPTSWRSSPAGHSVPQACGARNAVARLSSTSPQSPVTMSLPSGLKAAELTRLVWPTGIGAVPGRTTASQRCTVLSRN